MLPLKLQLTLQDGLQLAFHMTEAWLEVHNILVDHSYIFIEFATKHSTFISIYMVYIVQ